MMEIEAKQKSNSWSISVIINLEKFTFKKRSIINKNLFKFKKQNFKKWTKKSDPWIKNDLYIYI